MIPRSVTLRGFLCYKDEQVIDLDGCDLWVLAGRNGSGKSAVFDAMTFALFKAHRGGKQKAVNLIHTEAAELAVCFEFDLGPDRYRIRRTVNRQGTADRVLYRLVPQDDGTESWPAVPETQKDDGLDRWVWENVGLTYETFTASVLLLQGHSESLLSAKPTARFEIVAGIVDLESYRRLHGRADARRLRAKGLAESLRGQLQATTVVEPADVELAEARLAEADEARAVAEAEWKRLFHLGEQARSWLDLVGRRGKASARREHARRLIADSEAIARDWGRLQELGTALPVVRESLTRRVLIAQLEVKSRGGETERTSLSRRLDLVGTLAEDNRRHLESIEDEIGRDRERVQAILERQAALAGPIQRAVQARNLGEEVRRLEGVLASYPADIAARAAASEEEHRELAGWKGALPSLEALARERSGLSESRRRGLAAGRAIEAGTAEASRAESNLAERRSEESAASDLESQGRDRATETATIARALEDRLARFQDLDGSTTCDRCGQELTPEHLAAEAARRLDECDRAARIAEAAARDHRAAKTRHGAAEAARGEAERSLRSASEAIAAASRDLSDAQRDAGHHARACRVAFDRLDDPFRTRVAPEPPEDWMTTTFPEAGDLEEGRRLADEADEVLARLKALRAQLAEMEAGRTQLGQARHALAAVGLGPGDEAGEAEHAALQAERDSLARCLRGHEQERALAEQNRDALVERTRDLQGRVNEAERRLAALVARLDGLLDEAARARATAPEGWRDALDSATEADVVVWEDEHRSLSARGLAQLAAELPNARLLLDQAEIEIDDLDRQVSALPPEARRDPGEIADSIEEAERAKEQSGRDCRTRQSDLDNLCRDRDARHALESRTLAAERDRVIAETLAGLLGPRGLQRDLIRDAERGIVAHANPILREVSGGELELRLIETGDDEPDHALQLEAVEHVDGRTGTRGVEYLSGSQKFRVAVSLALAIGQYARGGEERSIESVIIDEGFGSLDSQGRDEMIVQLNALRGRLGRIILVSHQEEFAQEFRDGYRFEVVGGSTVARPFHR